MRTPKRNKLDPLDEIADAFDEGMSRIDKIAKKVDSMASMEAVRAIQDEMRTFAEERDKEQSTAMSERMDLVTGNLRQGIMTDVGKLLQENLSDWVEKSLRPLVDEIIEEREKASKAERDLELQRWQKRIAVATAIVLLFWAIFQPLGWFGIGQQSRIGTAIENVGSLGN